MRRTTRRTFLAGSLAADGYTDVRKLLDDKTIDAVTTANPFPESLCVHLWHFT